MKQKRLSIISFFFVLLFILFGCSGDDDNGNGSPTEPEPERKEINWLNESVTVSAGYYQPYSKNLQQGDSLDIQISLLQGDYIGLFFVADETNYYKWKANETYYTLLYRVNSTGGSFNIRIPSDGTYYYVIYNTAYLVSIEVYSKITIIRWE